MDSSQILFNINGLELKGPLGSTATAAIGGQGDGQFMQLLASLSASLEGELSLNSEEGTTELPESLDDVSLLAEEIGHPLEKALAELTQFIETLSNKEFESALNPALKNELTEKLQQLESTLGQLINPAAPEALTLTRLPEVLPTLNQGQLQQINGLVQEVKGALQQITQVLPEALQEQLGKATIPVSEKVNVTSELPSVAQNKQLQLPEMEIKLGDDTIELDSKFSTKLNEFMMGKSTFDLSKSAAIEKSLFAEQAFESNNKKSQNTERALPTSLHAGEFSQTQSVAMSRALDQANPYVMKHQPTDPKFSQEVFERVTIMANQQVKSAEIQLDPPELGQLQIQIRLAGEQASVTINSQHANVRDLIEQALPQLRDMLEEQGIELADAHVSDNANDGRYAEGDSGQGEQHNTSTGEQAKSDEQAAQAITLGLSDNNEDSGLNLYA